MKSEHIHLDQAFLTAYFDPTLSLPQIAQRCSLSLDRLAETLAQSTVQTLLTSVRHAIDQRNAFLAAAQRHTAIIALRKIIDTFNAEPNNPPSSGGNTHADSPDLRRRLCDSICRAAGLLLRFTSPRVAKPTTAAQPVSVPTAPLATSSAASPTSHPGTMPGVTPSSTSAGDIATYSLQARLDALLDAHVLDARLALTHPTPPHTLTSRHPLTPAALLARAGSPKAA